MYQINTLYTYMYSLDYALFCSIKSKLNWDCGHNNPILYMTIKYLLIFIEHVL